MNDCKIAKQKARNDGYVQLSRKGRMLYAHRLAYQEEIGRIPKGMTIDHVCRVKNCINTEHMEVVTAAENTKRRFMHQTHCKNGHKLSGDNLIITNLGYRRCRICQSASKRKYNHKIYYEIKRSKT